LVLVVLMEFDYKKLGLKCGLEVHQQLDTGKLFCRCPSVMRENKPDFTIRRYLRPVASELGEFDPAALEAFQKGLSYVYEGYNDTTCLIETDSEPPKPADKEALETILKSALLIGARIFDELFVMRKAVIDGSNTSGFQKTMLVATGGKLKLDSGKEINVQTLVLEEDAARPMQKTGNEIVYRLDRLGIPLIELATAPEIFSPEEAKEVALKIGEVFRRTCKAKRGLGTTRQDLNISIKEGARVEIKGVQDLQLMDEFVRREVQRQVKLVELREELKKRRVLEKDLNEQPVELTELFKETQSQLLSKQIKKGKKVFGLKLKGFAGLVGKELQPGRRFGTELADIVKARAGLQGIIHSDELPNYGITEQEIKWVKEKIDVFEKDAFAIVVGLQENCLSALEAINERSKQALKGVPEETRNALEDGNTSYSRPLPGAARMYPETDLEPIKIEEKYLKKLKKELPLSVKERIELYKKKGLSGNLIQGMKLSNHACFFEELLKKGFDGKKAAVLLLEGLQQLKREGIAVERISNKMIEELLDAERKGTITQDVFLDLLREWVETPSVGIDYVISKKGVKKTGTGEVEKIVKKVIEKNHGIVKEKGMHAVSALMGDVMKELKGKASGKTIAEVLRKELEKVVK